MFKRFNLWFLAGFFLFVFFSYNVYVRNTSLSLSFANYSPGGQNNSLVGIRPSSIKIDSLDINLPLVPATIDNGKWPSTKSGVSILTQSVVPGEKGNAVLYGHNWPNILGDLDKIRTNDLIIIKYSDNSEKIFTVEFTQEVWPDQTHILNPTQDSRLTIFTCSGFLDRKRFVATAILK